MSSRADALRSAPALAHQRHEQKLRERRQRRREAAVARQQIQSKEVVMDDAMAGAQPNERIYFNSVQLEKLYEKVDKSRGGMAAQYDLWSWIEAAFPQTAKGIWAIAYEDGKLTKAYLFKKYDSEDPEALQSAKQELEQRLAEITAKLKSVTIDELKSKMLTLMDVGEVVTISKPDPKAPAGPVLVPKDFEAGAQAAAEQAGEIAAEAAPEAALEAMPEQPAQ
jgi:hypothetical protein